MAVSSNRHPELVLEYDAPVPGTPTVVRVPRLPTLTPAPRRPTRTDEMPFFPTLSVMPLASRMRRWKRKGTYCTVNVARADVR